MADVRDTGLGFLDDYFVHNLWRITLTDDQIYSALRGEAVKLTSRQLRKVFTDLDTAYGGSAAQDAMCEPAVFETLQA